MYIVKIIFCLLFHFNPRSPSRERRVTLKFQQWFFHFNPRSPSRERLEDSIVYVIGYDISIHALQAESDTCLHSCKQPLKNFNPRSPSRERRAWLTGTYNLSLFQSTLSKQRATERETTITYTWMLFQSTLSKQRATCIKYFSGDFFWISIHALQAESDDGIKKKASSLWISIHALQAESDLTNDNVQNPFFISIHALQPESDIITLK